MKFLSLILLIGVFGCDGGSLFPASYKHVDSDIDISFDSDHQSSDSDHSDSHDGDVEFECSPIVENVSLFPAASCSHSDVNQAISEATTNGGGTVCLPSCTSEWWEESIQMPGGIGLLGQGSGSTILRSTAYRFFFINESGDRPGAFRVTGITFEGYHPELDSTVHNTITLNNIRGFRIDHCYFRGCAYCISANSRLEYPHSTGVIDHNIIERGDSTYESSHCISVGPKLWEPEMNLGTEQTIFIEDNTFIHCGTPATAYGGGHYVFRHNDVIDSASLGNHGPGYESTGRGTRTVEIYNNRFFRNFNKNEENQGRGWTAIGIHAGGGIITNNTFEYYSYGLRFSIDTAAVGRTRGAPCTGCSESDCFEIGEPCFVSDPDCYRYDAGAFQCSGCSATCFELSEPYEYPALDQVHLLWIWDNQFTDITHNDAILFYANDAENMILENRDYFRRAPNETQDGFVYSPYTYPHPLVLDE